MKTLKARVSVLSGLLFLRYVTVSSSIVPSLFQFVRVLGVSLYQLSFFILLSLHLLWPLSESLQPLGHRTSAQLRRLSRRHAKRYSLTLPYLVMWRTTSSTNNALLKEE